MTSTGKTKANNSMDTNAKPSSLKDAGMNFAKDVASKQLGGKVDRATLEKGRDLVGAVAKQQDLSLTKGGGGNKRELSRGTNKDLEREARDLSKTKNPKNNRPGEGKKQARYDRDDDFARDESSSEPGERRDNYDNKKAPKIQTNSDSDDLGRSKGKSMKKTKFAP